MSLLNRFIDHIKEEDLFQKKDRLLVAVSGGADSVVLCELCHQAGFNFEMAHCNFQLRGEESERDEKFVQALGSRYQTKVFIKKFDTQKYATEHNLSIQVAARDLRYEWFGELINSSTPNLQPSTFHPQPSTPNLQLSTLLLTAHHASDSVETLLMNFFKGTGIKGMQGIPVRHDPLRWIVRPLLFAKREEIVNFAKENNVAFVEDSSNTSDKYTRNYFRNQLIPSIQKVFPQAEENLMNNIERFKETEILYRQAIDFHKKKLLEYIGEEVHIPVLKLLKAEPLKTIMYEVIKDYGFTSRQAEEVLHLLKSDSGKYVSSDTHKIIRNRKWLVIAPHNVHAISLIVIGETDREVEFEPGTIKIEKHGDGSFRPSADNHTATLDAAAVRFPLLLRRWKQGDYFYPLGMEKKKKLNRFFTDQKMSLTEKEKAWVIESDKRILWIVGRRIDDRFKITDRTKDVLTIQFSEL